MKIVPNEVPSGNIDGVNTVFTFLNEIDSIINLIVLFTHFLTVGKNDIGRLFLSLSIVFGMLPFDNLLEIFSFVFDIIAIGAIAFL